MRLQVLRETRMPAVLASLADVQRTVDLSTDVTAVVRSALEAWAAKPLEDRSNPPGPTLERR